MQEQHSCRAFLGEEQSGTQVQEKYRTSRPSETLHRHAYCFITIIVLAMSLIILPVTLTVLVKAERPVSDVRVHSTCLPKWIGFGNKCFSFSETTGNWTTSQTSCKKFEADLVQIDSVDELSFLQRYKGPYDHWIGLSRESPSHPWKWTNSTADNIVFPVRGTGECAYLNRNGVSSGGFYTDRRWICSKPIRLACSCQNAPNS